MNDLVVRLAHVARTAAHTVVTADRGRLIEAGGTWTLALPATATACAGFMAHLKIGGGCTLKTAARVMAWFSDNWPSDLEWPRHIPRPNATKGAA
ncbi:hypothetical protein RNZ50_15930 [Paracoccaceae bacterium Fryx2]|nr:hypothetical protein [Paracoccaceae bacterium Fryx2]